MTVRTPTEEEKRRAELIAQGVLPASPEEKPGAKGRAEAKRRFG